MKHYLDKIYKILLKARKLADSQQWEELEEFADLKLDEVMELADKAILSASARKYCFSEEMRWEFYSTLTGSHFIDVKLGKNRFTMSLNLEGEEPTLILS